MLLPPGIRDTIDAKRRAFRLWSGTDCTTGAQCLVAWEKVCELKEDGGLGVKRLDTQNAALMLKLIHRLHRLGESAWANWVSYRTSIHNLARDLDGDHWNALRQLLPVYQQITTVDVGDGRTTDFWRDNWIGNATLTELAPTLHSHTTVAAPSVNYVICTGLRSGMIYKTSSRGDQLCPSFHFVWRNFAPPRVKIFAWTLTKQRIQCKTVLCRKNILQTATCDVCGNDDETADHIISQCPFVKAFWRRIGWDPNGIAPVAELWKMTAPYAVPVVAKNSPILLFCWQLWKHRHDVVFRTLPPNLNRLASTIKETACSWQCLLPGKTKRF